MYWIALLLTLFLVGCSEQPGTVSGYVEGVYTEYSSPLPGVLLERPDFEGQFVSKGSVLFKLDQHPELDQLDQINAQIDGSISKLKNLQQGYRQSRMVSLQANIDAAQSDVNYQEGHLNRLINLSENRTVSKDALDQARSKLKSLKASLEDAKAQYDLGQLGEREDVIDAQHASIRELEAKKREINWSLDQKMKTSSLTGYVKEIYYNIGEWVPAYAPILSIENTQKRHVVFYLNQAQLSKIELNDIVSVRCTGCDSVKAIITSVADQAEFTPPVVYTTEQGELYRFKVRADLLSSMYLHPGQPVTVELLNNET